MKLMQLRCFYEVAKMKNFTAAANNLFIAQSSLSYAISNLEAELDVPLFVRGANKKTELTTYGALLLPFVETSLKSLSDGENELKNLFNPLSGNITIGFFFCISFSMIPYVFRKFNNEYPTNQIQIEFDVNHYWTDLEGKLIQGSYDIVISAAPEMKNCKSIPVAKQELFLILPNTHPLAARNSIKLEELQKEIFIRIDPHSYLDNHIDEMFKFSDISPTSTYSSDWTSQFSSISMGKGVAISAKLPANEDFISIIKIDHPMTIRNLYLSYPINRKLPPNVLLLRDFIVDLSKRPDELLIF
mgnify:CR=1 FL=1